jgi:hypothetical protein
VLLGFDMSRKTHHTHLLLRIPAQELQVDYAYWMQTNNFASYAEVAATEVDTIMSMDTYGKLGNVFGWITQLNAVASCMLPEGSTGRSPCMGVLKYSAGMWPLAPFNKYQGGFPLEHNVNEVLSNKGPNGVAQLHAGKNYTGVRQICIWDAFGETWTNRTGGPHPGVHKSIPQYWWSGFKRFLTYP